MQFAKNYIEMVLQFYLGTRVIRERIPDWSTGPCPANKGKQN